MNDTAFYLKSVLNTENEKACDMEMLLRRFTYKGKKEQLPEIEAALKKKNIDRHTMYLILKHFEINPNCAEILEQEFPDV